jgi:hypothetical protein
MPNIQIRGYGWLGYFHAVRMRQRINEAMMAVCYPDDHRLAFDAITEIVSSSAKYCTVVNEQGKRNPKRAPFLRITSTGGEKEAAAILKQFYLHNIEIDIEVSSLNLFLTPKDLAQRMFALDVQR